MAETLYTPDDRMHVLVGSTTLESIIREYAGDEAADRIKTALERAERLHHSAQDWADKLRSAAYIESECTEAFILNTIQEVIDQIESTLDEGV